MRAGRLRHLVRLEAPAAGAPGAHGDRAHGWEAMGDAYAEVVPLSGRELELARQLDGRTTHRVRIRYQPGVSTTWRVVLEARQEAAERNLQIASILNVGERDRELELLCVEVTP